MEKEARFERADNTQCEVFLKFGPVDPMIRITRVFAQNTNDKSPIRKYCPGEAGWVRGARTEI